MANLDRIYKYLQLNIKSYSHFAVELFLLLVCATVVGANLYLRTNLAEAQMPNKSLFFVHLKNYVSYRNEKLVDAHESIRIKLHQTQNSGNPASSASRQILAASTIDKQMKSNNPKEAPLPTLSGSALLKPNPAGSEMFLTNRDVEIQKYQVRPGDNVSQIASEFNISIDTIKWENNLSAANPVIKPGEILTILPMDGVMHTIKEGETVSEIAKKYGLSSEEDIEQIYAINGIDGDDGFIIAGDQIFIPNGIKRVPPTPQRQQYLADLKKNDFKQVEVPEDYAGSGSGLIWPIPCAHKLSQGASKRHMAIDVPAKYCQVVAAADGVVEIAGWQTGYGNTAVVNHGNGLRTRYAHGSKLLVSAGDQVTQGQAIMVSGNTGRSTGPHLHFEVKIGKAHQNPLNYITP